MRPTNAQLIRDLIRDQITDVRCALRDNKQDYAAQCRERIKSLWPIRHKARLDHYGWPEVWKKQ